MFGFTPLSELDCLNLLPVGEYDFMVKNAESTTSKKSGLPMMKLTLGVYDNAGREHTVIDYLIETMMFKVKHFADAVGLEKEYESGGFLPTSCVNRTGKVKIIIDEPQEGSQYLPKNAVKDYVKRSKVEAPRSEIDPSLNDDIPDFT